MILNKIAIYSFIFMPIYNLFGAKALYLKKQCINQSIMFKKPPTRNRVSLLDRLII